jgi:hypothetical protein
MAQVKDNIVTEGFSGKLANKIVFRQVGNRTIVAKRPRRSEIISEDQAAHRQRFKSAAAYARAKMQYPAEKAAYAELAKRYELTSAFAAAVGDYLTPPDIDTINTEGYSGQVGDVILITSTNSPKIASLQVSIIQPGGDVLETGAAVFSPADAAWKYVATVAGAVAPGTVIKAVATDRPGNVVTKEKAL